MTKLQEMLKGPSGRIILGISLALMLMVSVIIISERKTTVALTVDGNKKIITTYESTVKDVIEGENISLDKKDKVSQPLDSKLQEGMDIKVKKAVALKVDDGGEKKEIKSAADTVSEMLKEENIALGEKDKISPAIDEKVKPNMEINVVRVTEKVEKLSQNIPYALKKTVDHNLSANATKVVTAGEEGLKEITVKTVLENGKEVSKETVSETVVKKPVDRVVAAGPSNHMTLTASRGNGGFNDTFKRKLRMTATAYSMAPYDPLGGGSITASGMKVKRDPNGVSTVAVDPKVIPLGTKLYVEGYGYAIAADTGGAVKGNKIDLYFNPGAEFKSWGKRSVNVYVIK